MYGSSLPLSVFQSGDRCVWSAADWVYIGDDVGCTAANVEVGACAVDGSAYCALSRESCTDAYGAGTFWDHRQVQEEFQAYCYLAGLPRAMPPPAPPGEAKPKVIVHAEEAPPEAAPEPVVVETVAEDPQVLAAGDGATGTTEGGLDQTTLVVVVALTAVVAGLVLGVGVTYWRRRAARKESWRQATAQDAAGYVPDLELEGKGVNVAPADAASDVSEM